MRHKILRKPGVLSGAILALALATMSSTAFAVTFNVGPTRATRSPCALLSDGSITLRPGDVIEVDPGTYREACRIEESGTAALPLILRGVGGRPVMDGTGLTLDGDAGRPRALFQFSSPDGRTGANNWILENLEIRNASNAGNNASGIRVTERSTNVVLRNLLVHDNQNGVTSDTGGGLAIEGCEIYQNGTGTAATAGHNIFLSGTTARVVGNIIRDSRGGQNVRMHMNHAVLSYNYILRGGSYDIDIDHNYKNELPTSRIIMIGNVVARSPTASNSSESIVFGIDSTAPGRPDTAVYMYNNTFLLAAASNRLLNGLGPSRGTVRLHFYNNLVTSTVGAGGVTSDAATDSVVEGSNNFLRTGVFTSTSLLRTVTATDPQFTSATNLTPIPGSPVIDQGATPPAVPDATGMMVSGVTTSSPRLPLPTVGFTARTISNAIDIGAYEGVSTPSVDTDGDGLLDPVETRIGTDPRNPDTDGDSVRDGTEVGPSPAAPRDTDSDGMIDALDTDDDNDTVPTRTERPSNMDRNTDGDALPDYLDPDDDADSIPTRVERTQDLTPTDNFDGDANPSYLDTDADGDTVPDRTEAGADGNNPADTDRDGAPDYLDLDSDNDCLPDARETGAARTTPATMPDANCSGATPVCDTMRGVCIARPTSPDTDGDGLPDDVETRIGTDPRNPDTDMDGIPDGREVGPTPTAPRDSDMDRVIDALDPDDDGDGIPTRDERPMGLDRDSDTDGTPDHLDPDDDNDGIPTISERPMRMNRDTDADGTPDHLDVDDDADGIPTRAERPMIMDRNTDGDGQPDHLDPDDDNDGLPTRDERPTGADRNTDGDPLPDHLDADDDADSIPTRVERMQDATPTDDFDADRAPSHLDTDADGDTVPDRTEAGPDGANPVDTDRDGAPDYLDLDSDNDCLPDVREPGAPRTMPAADANTNCTGLTPVCDTMRGVCVPRPGAPDTDMDGVPDDIETRIGTNPRNPDTDGDGIPDGREIGTDLNNPRNTDGDPLIDALDTDDDGDGILTRDERPMGADRDTDMDGVPDHLDPDDDNDGILTRDERPMGMNRDTDMDGTPDHLDADDDGDGIPTRTERPMGADRDTDVDGAPDHLDADDDNDGIPTRDERPMATDRDTDVDGAPDHLDPDDDADSIPTRVERMQDATPTDDFDADGAPSHLDTDADGDTVPDRTEAGADGANPVDTDGDGARDYLDLDSDNDCLPDVREPGATRTTPAAMPDANCSGATPVCDTMRGVCGTRVDGGDAGDSGSDASVDASVDDSGVAFDGGRSPTLTLTGNGCGCSTVGAGTSDDAALALGVGLLGLAVARRRRRAA